MVNKTILVNDMNRLKNKDSLSKIIKNWNVVYDIREEAVIDILNTICVYHKNNDVKDTDLRYLFSLLFDIIISDTTNLNTKIIMTEIDRCIRYSDNDILVDRLKYLNTKIRTMNRLEVIDRNHKKIASKLNLDVVAHELNLSRSNESAISTIYPICDAIINEYSKLDKNRLIGICMENVRYFYNKIGAPVSNEDILYEVTEYFLISEKYDIKSISSAIDSLLLYTDKEKKKSKKCISNIIEDRVINKDTRSIEESLLNLDVKSKFSTIRNFSTDMLRDINKSKNNRNSKNGSKRVIDKVYKIPIDALTKGAPDLLGIVRKTIVYGGSFVISPYLTIPAIITDIIISNKVNKPVADKLYNDLLSEKEKIEKELDKTTLKNKEDLSNYLNNIDDQLSRVGAYIQGTKSKYAIDEDYNMSDYMYIKECAFILSIENGFKTDIITESTGANIIRRAREKLNKTVSKLSAKEKSASRKLDTAVEKVQNDIQKAAAVENRDKVIEGKVLPSASKTIKLAISMGAAWAINPAIAVIGALGGIAVSKKTRDRERQMILDEIDVHLKIVDRKVKQAEMSNDDKAIEELLKLENKLKREKQRITYRMKIYR